MATYISFEPRDEFSATVSTGDSASQAITVRSGFSPSCIWNKRTDAIGTTMYNFFSVLGTGEYQKLFEAVADVTDAASITSFDANGFTLGSGLWNATSSTYVNYCWNGDSTSVPSGGTITPSAANVNTTSGFAMFRYTGNGVSGANIAHGLGKAPKHIIIKRDSGENWVSDVGNREWDTNYLRRNSYVSQLSGDMWASTKPTSTLFYLGNHEDVNYATGGTYTAMVWTDIKGYSAFGDFTGNSSTDGMFIYTGFRPKTVTVKRYDSGSCNWIMWDTNKNTYNLSDWFIYTDNGGSNNGYTQDAANYSINILSNGFKLKVSTSCMNGGSHRYTAFAEFPLVSSNNIPGVAR